jgi:peptidoglycan/xylan/chitin deacetylase (PgdA/CDA1 family)
MTRLNSKQGNLPHFIYYHTVSDRQPPHLKYLIHMKNSKEFERDIDFLFKNYEFISISNFIENTHVNKHLGKKKIVLTFDDGYSEVYDIVQPILQQKGIPAAIFITTDFLDNQDLFYKCKISLVKDTIMRLPLESSTIMQLSQISRQKMSSNYDIIKFIDSLQYKDVSLLNSIAKEVGIDFDKYLNLNKPYLTSEQIFTLIDKGFEIGAHSLDHPYFGKISFDEQLQQTKASMDIIQQKFRLSYRYFALPHSDAGISSAYYFHAGKLADIILGGYGLAIHKNYKYYQRFSIEKYRLSPSLAWALEVQKVKLKKAITSFSTS